MRLTIAGGGIAGIAAALALARTGRCEVRVLEQAERFEEAGAGLQLGPNAMRALAALGVAEAAAPLIFRPRSVNIRDGLTGRFLSRVPLDARFLRRFGAPYCVALRADLLRALLEVAGTDPRIALETGRRIAALDGTTLALSDGSRIEADAVVAADGIRSTLRHRLLGDGAPQHAGHVIFRALLPAESAPDAAGEGAVTLWLLPGGHAVHYPVGAGKKINVVAVIDGGWEREGWSAPAAREELLTVFGPAHPALRRTLEATDAWVKFAAADRAPAGQWGRGPVTLVGDAAHPTLPYLAQGAAMALEDAVVLGRAVGEGGAAEEAFRRYEALRQPRTARLTLLSRRLGRLYHAHGLLRLARNAILAATPPALGLSNIAWLYRWRP